MLTIRLQRTGKRNQADFRIVLAEKTAAASKKCLEVLGSYNPYKKDFKIKEERLKYWIAQRVQISPTLHNLLVSKNFLEGQKVKAFKIKKKKETQTATQVKNQTPAMEAGHVVASQAPVESQPQPAVEPPAPSEEKKEDAAV